MKALRQIYDGITNDLHIILPSEFQHRKLEVIILPLEDIDKEQSATLVLEHFLASKDMDALADLDTNLFSQDRKADSSRIIDL